MECPAEGRSHFKSGEDTSKKGSLMQRLDTLKPLALQTDMLGHVLSSGRNSSKPSKSSVDSMIRVFCASSSNSTCFHATDRFWIWLLLITSCFLGVVIRTKGETSDRSPRLGELPVPKSAQAKQNLDSFETKHVTFIYPNLREPVAQQPWHTARP